MAITIQKKHNEQGGELISSFVGLDTSTKTGYARVGWFGGNDFRVIETAEYKTPKMNNNIERADRIWSQVMAPILSWRPEVLVIENYGFGNAHTLVTLVEIGTVIRHGLWEQGVEYFDVPPTTIKKFVTGKGNAKKDAMMKEVYKRWQFEGTDNECDAVALAMFGAAMHGKVDLPKVNLQAVTDWMKKHKIEINCN